MGITSALLNLRHQAEESMRARGHKPGIWLPLGPHKEHIRCLHCRREAVIDEAPAPNAIDVGGEAVAVNCDGGTYP